MPIYVFKCAKCMATSDRVLPMSQSGSTQLCEQCSQVMQRSFASGFAHVAPDSYAKPLHSDSLGIVPSQVAEHQRLFPDIKIDTECRPVFENFSQHNAYLEKIGAVKQPNKRGKRRSTRIS